VAEGPLTAPGVYRWSVKTVSDDAADALKSTPPGTYQWVDAKIPDLTSLPAPHITIDLPRQPGAESTIWKISATLVAFKPEADQDYHLVIHDDSGNSMIVEIPDPTILTAACRFTEEITAARQAFDAKFGLQMKLLEHATALMAAQPNQEPLPLMITNVNTPVVVTGVGYFDEIHGQTGVAPNGLELHPVLNIEFP
jgi:hypothetical protein